MEALFYLNRIYFVSQDRGQYCAVLRGRLSFGSNDGRSLAIDGGLDSVGVGWSQIVEPLGRVGNVSRGWAR